VWGEAGNMRFMPEFLSWVYHQFVTELVLGTGGQRKEAWRRRDYLNQVIKPMYEYLKSEMHKKNVAGVLAEHIYKKNYDDINEYFWKEECTDSAFSLRSNSDRLDAQSGQSYRESNVPHGAWDVKPLVQQGLRQQQKTFLERRGMMHSFKANLRVFTFYLALFQVIVTIAHDVPFQQDVLPLCPPQLQISAQTPDEILNDMDRSYGPTCDLNTAMCQYTSKYNTHVTYSCLDQLGSTRAERVAATQKYMDLSNEVWSILYDLIPLYDGPIDNRTGLALARSEQLHTFDTIWRGDGLPTILGDDGDLRCDQDNGYYMYPRGPDGKYKEGGNCFKTEGGCDPEYQPDCKRTDERSVGNYGPKRDFLKLFGSKLFTCGFNDTDIMKQANNSICC
jgi:hypothetical protein